VEEIEEVSEAPAAGSWGSGERESLRDSFPC